MDSRKRIAIHIVNSLRISMPPQWMKSTTASDTLFRKPKKHKINGKAPCLNYLWKLILKCQNKKACNPIQSNNKADLKRGSHQPLASSKSKSRDNN